MNNKGNFLKLPFYFSFFLFKISILKNIKMDGLNPEEETKKMTVEEAKKVIEENEAAEKAAAEKAAAAEIEKAEKAAEKVVSAIKKLSEKERFAFFKIVHSDMELFTIVNAGK